jgi:hypothetical protein
MKTLIKTTIIVLSALVSIPAGAQNPVNFPVVKGETLDNKVITIPHTNTKYTIIGVAFNRHAEDELKRWLNPMYETFIKDESGGGGFDMAEYHDVNFIFIPMIAGLSTVADDFKKGTDKQFWPYILDIEKKDAKELERVLNVKDNKIPYFYAVDPNGKILEMVSGSYSSDKLDKLEEAVDK